MTEPHDLIDELAAVRADNARLRRLLDEAGLHDGLRHAFRDTVTILRVILRRTAETADDAESYAAHLEGRLDAIVRVRYRTDAFGEADLHSLVSDELVVHLVHEGERARLAGPGIYLRARAAQVLALALHELASNAVEHGPLGGPDGRVQVTWRIEPGEAAPSLVLVWKEEGAAELVEPDRRGFGTMVLKEMLAYDLKAETEAVFDADGLRYTIRLPLPPRIGRLAAEDDEAAGDQDALI